MGSATSGGVASPHRFAAAATSIIRAEAPPRKVQKAVNQLLSDRFIEGRKGDEGRMTIALNGHKLAEVRREIRPVWINPLVWMMAAGVVAVAGWFIFGAGAA